MQAYNLSAAEVRHIETQQLTELWGKYGNNGNLSELWFDGGVNGPMQPVSRLCSSHSAALTMLLLCTHLPVTLSLLTLAVSLHVPLIGNQKMNSDLQPHAMAFNSCMQPTAHCPHTGSAHASANPNWSTQNFSNGDELFAPTESVTSCCCASESLLASP